MATTPTNVLGIKYGTFASYQALSSKDPDTLYFITDKGGAIYRGYQLVIPTNVIEEVKETVDANNDRLKEYKFKINGFQTSHDSHTPDTPVTYEFTVVNKETILAIQATLNTKIDVHRKVGGSGTTQDPNVYADGKATDTNYGHILLTDAVDIAAAANNASAAAGGKAVTPLGVYNAIQNYLPAIGAMRFMGTVGATHGHPVSNPNSIQSNLPASHAVGDVWVVADAGTYAGKTCEAGDMIFCIKARATANNDDWTIVQVNLVGAVTTTSTLTTDQLVVGGGNKTAKALPAGTEGDTLRMVGGKPAWDKHSLAYGRCNTGSATALKTILSAGSPLLVHGAIVSVWFEDSVKPVENSNPGDGIVTGPVKMRISTGTAHYVMHLGDTPIQAGEIAAGDTATFIYDDKNAFSFTWTPKNGDPQTFNIAVGDGVWRLISVDKRLADVAFSGSYTDLTDVPTNLSDFANDIGAWFSCPTAAATTTKTVSNDGFTLKKGAILAVRFTYGVPAGATLKVNGGQAYGIYRNNGSIADNIIEAGDTATFLFYDSKFHLLSLDRKADTAITQNSNAYATSNAVYQAIEAARLKWEPISNS